MRVLFAGGGTGGHIYPALALARYLRDMDRAEILFVGTEKGMENEIVPAEGFPLRHIPVTGLQRRLSLQVGRALLLAASSVIASKRIIRSFSPDVVVGTGGYVAGPVMAAAWLSRIPTVIHEQNAIPGLTNIMLSRFVSRVCLSFAGSERHFPGQTRMVLTGNPRASEAAAAAARPDGLSLKILPGVPLLLCVGGSHGAARLNEAFSGSLEFVLRSCDVQVVYITGKRYFEETDRTLAQQRTRFPNRLQIIPYHSGMPALMAKTSLMVSRAGATTLAEITALGVPSVLIPSPNVTKNHQEHNARLLADHGAAVLIRESELNGSLGVTLVSLLRDRDRLQQMAGACKSLGIPDAAGKMAAVIRSLLE